jgi:hypothetical protein
VLRTSDMRPPTKTDLQLYINAKDAKAAGTRTASSSSRALSATAAAHSPPAPAPAPAETQYTGVSYVARLHKWRSCFFSPLEKKTVGTGSHATAYEAARARHERILHDIPVALRSRVTDDFVYTAADPRRALAPVEASAAERAALAAAAAARQIVKRGTPAPVRAPAAAPAPKSAARAPLPAPSGVPRAPAAAGPPVTAPSSPALTRSALGRPAPKTAAKVIPPMRLPPPRYVQPWRSSGGDLPSLLGAPFGDEEGISAGISALLEGAQGVLPTARSSIAPSVTEAAAALQTISMSRREDMSAAMGSWEEEGGQPYDGGQQRGTYSGLNPPKKARRGGGGGEGGGVASFRWEGSPFPVFHVFPPPPPQPHGRFTAPRDLAPLAPVPGWLAPESMHEVGTRCPPMRAGSGLPSFMAHLSPSAFRGHGAGAGAYGSSPFHSDKAGAGRRTSSLDMPLW